MHSVANALNSRSIPFTRVEGVNGWQLSDTEVHHHYDASLNRRLARRDLTKAEIGCYLSHLDVWSRIADGNELGAFVFEDDIAVTGDLQRAIRLLSEDKERTWDMVKLFSLRPILKLARARALSPELRVGVPFEIPTCLNGYGITRRAAQKLVARDKKIFRPVDEDQKFFWETGLHVELVFPTPIGIGEQAATTGTVGGSRRLEKHRGWRQALRGLAYSADYHARLAYHRARQGYKYERP